MAGLHIPQRALRDGLPRHFFQTQTLGAKLDFIHRVGFGLTTFVFHGFQTACFFVSTSTKSNTPLMPSFSADMHRPLKAHALARFRLARIHSLMQPCPARSNSSPPTPARYESTHIGAGRRRSVAGRKGNQAVLIFPWVSVESAVIFFLCFTNRLPINPICDLIWFAKISFINADGVVIKVSSNFHTVFLATRIRLNRLSAGHLLDYYCVRTHKSACVHLSACGGMVLVEHIDERLPKQFITSEKPVCLAKWAEIKPWQRYSRRGW